MDFCVGSLIKEENKAYLFTLIRTMYTAIIHTANKTTYALTRALIDTFKIEHLSTFSGSHDSTVIATYDS